MFYFVYYCLVIIGLVFYFYLRNKTMSCFNRDKKLNRKRVFAIIYFYCIGTMSLYIAVNSEGDDAQEWIIYISSIIIFFLYLFIIWAFETPKKFKF
ncbi:Uncharacterised protein [Providencia stuartii]|nr:Uncharacterised protein [Providencia stuartii]